MENTIVKMTESLRSIVIEPKILDENLVQTDTKKNGDFLQKIEELTHQNEILKNKNLILKEDLEKAAIKIESLYTDKIQLEELVLNIDDNQMETEIEEVKQKTEKHFEQKFEFEIENLTNKINELKHNCLNLELENKELILRVENKENDINDLNDKIMYYEDNYVLKQKYETLNTELSQFKTENTELDTRVLFKDIKVKELQKKILENKEKYENKLLEVQNKMEKKIEQEKENFKLEITKLEEKIILTKDSNQIPENKIQDHQMLNKMYFNQFL